MSINKAITLIEETKWTKINNFSVYIDFMNEQFKNIINYPQGTELEETLKKSVISITTPTYNNTFINKYVSYEYRFHQGKDEIYRFSITFRDFDQMKLFKVFRDAYIKGKFQYYDNIRMNIVIYNDEDFGVEQKPIFWTTTAIIETISQLSFSHSTENQIAEFTVGFVCNTSEQKYN